MQMAFSLPSVFYCIEGRRKRRGFGIGRIACRPILSRRPDIDETNTIDASIDKVSASARIIALPP